MKKTAKEAARQRKIYMILIIILIIVLTVLGGGYLVVKVRDKLTRCEADELEFICCYFLSIPKTS